LALVAFEVAVAGLGMPVSIKAGKPEVNLFHQLSRQLTARQPSGPAFQEAPRRAE
jgi:hypothetical protein